MKRSAEISLCGLYRWSLERDWSVEEKKTVLFVLNNPSTADAKVDDPTVRRGIAFARSWGYNRMIFANTNPYRSTDPKLAVMPPEGILYQNDNVIESLARSADIRIAAWGLKANRALAIRALHFMLKGGPVDVIAFTKNGTPNHPLYLPGDLKPQPWDSYADV